MKRIREIFRRFEPYGWETPTREIAASVGLRPEQIARMDTNTSPFAPSAELAKLASMAEKLPVNEYPDTTYLDLRNGLSSYCGGIDPERFVVTNGADEGLDIVGKTTLDPGDEVLVPAPSYAMFRVVPELMGARVKFIPRGPDFSISPDALLAEAGKRTSLIFLCNPNSPTGNPTPIGDVEKVAKGTEAAVLVDEAYFEFWGKSSIGLTDRYDNLIVCRTFSKAFSMAGVRVGYLVAQRPTVDQLNAVRPPNSLTVPSLLLAQAALANLEEMRKNVWEIVAERRRVSEVLRDIEGITPYPSETNFILFRIRSERKAVEVHQALVRKGFVLRTPPQGFGVDDCLRVTISSREVNDGFVEALDEIMSGGPRK